ncbi:hypothetical protein HY500_04470 [Candidatus Woesearchaeota archaeon]|nr:hypothetical protein [Candidatus Woesearchaeota archaeon]
MARQEARNAVGTAIDQILQAAPDAQTVRDNLAAGFLQGISNTVLNLANLGQVGLTLDDVYRYHIPVRQLSDAVESLFTREIHERRMQYSRLYGEVVENLVKV